MKELITKVQEWSIERNIDKANPKEQTLNVAYNEIKDRKGKTIGGVFIKEKDL